MSGVRIWMALGAAPGNLLTMVLRSGMVPVLTTASALILAAAATVLLAGALAAVVPAWRAGSVGPVEALRRI